LQRALFAWLKSEFKNSKATICRKGTTAKTRNKKGQMKEKSNIGKIRTI
jgi:hypothetical protein